MIEIKRYESKDKPLWNEFIASAKNATFLFNRNFMDYHKERFEDYSLLCFKKDKLIAILPANVIEDVVHTHMGLSYGGIISNKILRLKDSLAIIVKILQFLKSKGKSKLVYKKPPFIYQGLEGLQMDTILFLLKAKCYRSDTYLIIDSDSYSINRNRKRAIKTAKDYGVTVQENEYEKFWNKLLIPNLKKRFDVFPVHTVDEILLLKRNFPESINCYTAYVNNSIKAGVVVFVYDTIVHFQYSSASNTRNDDGAIDYLFYYIINKYSNKKYISLGSSSEGTEGRVINEGLLYWKESFGAVSIPQEYYEIETSSTTLTDNIFS